MSLKHGVLLALIAGIVFPAIGQQLLPSSPAPGAPASSNDAPTVAIPPPEQAASTAPASQPSESGRASATRLPQLPADAPRAQRGGVDETAVRYFAAQGDTRRLEAEIARLRALYPNWSPPDELGEATGDAELERMWKLYADGKYAEVRGAIAQRLADDPSWVVPDDLLQRLDAAEASRRLVNASDAGQWNSVISIATETPTLLTCESVDMLWRVAEAFAKTSRPERALGAYTYVLTNCENTSERLATVQKAIALLPDEEIEKLMKYERNNEFDPVRDDLARRRVNAAALDPKKTAAADDLVRLERLARSDQADIEDALSLGWYDFHHAMLPAGLDWFKLAFERKGGAKAAEGMVYTLSALDRLLEAEPLAYDWRTATPDNLKAYLDLMVTIFSQDEPPLKVEPSVLTRFTAVLEQTKYALGAQAVGFYSYNTSQFSTAVRWFQTALRWQPDMEPAAYGLVLCGLRIPNRELFNQTANVWRDRSARIYELTLPPSRRRPQLPSRPLVGDLSQPVTVLPSPTTLGYGPGYRPAAGARGIYDYQVPPQADPMRPMASAMPGAPPSAYGAPPAGYAAGGQNAYRMPQAAPNPYGMAQATQSPYGMAPMGADAGGVGQQMASPARTVQSQPRGTSSAFSGGMMPASGLPSGGGLAGTGVPPGTFMRREAGTARTGAAAPAAPAMQQGYDPAQAAYPTAQGNPGAGPATGYSGAPSATYPGTPAPASPANAPAARRSDMRGPVPGLRPAGDPVAYQGVPAAGPRIIIRRPGAPAQPRLVADNTQNRTAGYLPSSRVTTAPASTSGRVLPVDANTYTVQFNERGETIQLAQAMPAPSNAAPSGGPAMTPSGQMLSVPSVTVSGTSNSVGNNGGATYASPGTYKPTSPPADYYGVATSGYGPAPTVQRGGGRRSASGGAIGAGKCGTSDKNVRLRTTGAGALALGWCLMELDRPLEAAKAFDQAVLSSTGQVRQEAAYGKSLAFLRKGLTDEAALAAAEAPQTVRRSVQLGSSILTQRALASYQDKRYVETIIALDERSRLVPEQIDLMLLRGYAYLELGRYDDAEQLFRAVERTGVSREAGRGINTILARTRQVIGD